MSDTAYHVLARKYRPGHFRDLIGQEAMVRTLTNAFAHDRIAHAFIMTGVRGVGKTTTARIIARGLNCQAGDKATIDPCGTCEACVSIAEGRAVDVIEMDAASHTGVDNVRTEILDSIAYAPVSCRFKVFVVDEVHMLSTSSFNALLKTLEEPPAHVKFIFATTDIHKVPVTVLSRCQRFDLRRIEPEVMMSHLSGIAGKEGASMTEDALALITRAAEGSVRDALSLMDQAIANGSGAEIDAGMVRAMLGLADRGRVFDLFELIMKGDAAGALAELGAQYADGADPGAVLRDLAELTHWLSVLKVSAEAAEDATISATERARGADLAGRLAMRVLTRTWQMLLKAIEELPLAPNAMMAAEMAVIRLTHVADLPPPGDLVRRLTEDAQTGGGSVPSGPASGGSGPRAQLVSVATAVEAPRPSSDPATVLARFSAFEDVVALIKTDSMPLAVEVEDFVHLVAYRPGLIEFRPAPGAPTDLAGRLMSTLSRLTGERWGVTVSDIEGAPTITDTRRTAKAAEIAEVQEHPLVAAALAIWPDAIITGVRDATDLAPAPDDYLAAVPEDDDDADLLDDDDPFGEDI